MNTIVEHINSAGFSFVEFAVPMLIQSGILIVILLLADLLLRKKVKAVFRYWIWMLVLMKLVLPTSLSSPLSLGYLFGEKLTYQELVETASMPESTGPVAAETLPGINPLYIQPNPYVQPKVPVTSVVESEIAEPTSPSPASVTPLSWQGVVFLVWLAVVIAMGLLLLQRALFVRGLVAQARDAPRLMNDALEYCLESMKIRRKVGLKISPNATTPSVCGLIRPVILVPWNLASTLGASRLRTVLMHELAHIRRADLWVNLAQTILQIMYFYNPLLWIANCVIRRIREQAVDETVLVTMGRGAQQYPQMLVDVAKMAFERPALSLRLIGVVESESALAGRIKHILGRPMPRSAKIGVVGALAIIIAGAILLPMARASRGVVLTVAADGSAEYSSIQKAIDAASAGAVVRIAPGIYKEQIEIDKPLTLEGAGWDKTTITTENNTADVFEEVMDRMREEFAHVSMKKMQDAKTEQERKAVEAEFETEFRAKCKDKFDVQAVLVSDTEGVVIRGLKVSFPGRHIEDHLISVPIVRFSNAEAKMSGCVLAGCPGDGIHVMDGSDLEIRNCLVGGLWGTGIVVGEEGRADSRLRILDSDVRNCYYAGIWIRAGNKPAEIKRCRVSGAAWHGIIYSGNSPTIEDNAVFGNARIGIGASHKAAGTVRRNIIYGNEIGGMSCSYGSRPVIKGNTFANNKESGLRIFNTAKPFVRKNIFAGNPTAVFCGDFGGDEPSVWFDGVVTLENNLFWDYEHKAVWQHNATKEQELKVEDISLGKETGNIEFDPLFVNLQGKDFSLSANSPALVSGIGVSEPLAFDSPWPLQEEELAIIPDGDTRDWRHWKQKAESNPMARAKNEDGFSDRDLLIKCTELTEGEAKKVSVGDKTIWSKGYEVEFAPQEKLLLFVELYRAGRPMRQLGGKVFSGSHDSKTLSLTFTRTYKNSAKTIVGHKASVRLGEEVFEVEEFTVNTQRYFSGEGWGCYHGNGLRRLKERHTKKDYAKLETLFYYFCSDGGGLDEGEAKFWVPGHDVTQVGSYHFVVLKMIPLSSLKYLYVEPIGGYQGLDGKVIPRTLTLEKADQIADEYKQMIIDSVEKQWTAEEQTEPEASLVDASLDHFIGRYAVAGHPDTPAFEIKKEGDVFIFRDLGGPKFEIGFLLKGLEGRRFEMEKGRDNLKFGNDPRERYRVRYNADEDLYILDSLGMRGEVQDSMISPLTDLIKISPKKPDGTFAATLPNDVTVELVGLCEHASVGKQWWRPDGTLWEDRPYEEFSSYHSMSVERGYELVWRLSSDEDIVYEVESADQEGSAGRDVLQNERGLRPALKNGEFYGVVFFFSQTLSQAPINIGVGLDRNWKTISSLEGDLSKAASGLNNVHLYPAIEADGRTYIDAAYRFPEGKIQAYRLVAVDKSNKQHVMQQGSETKSRGNIHCRKQIDLPLKQIKTISFQSQPLQWVTFENVSLRPGIQTNVQVQVQEVAAVSAESEVGPVPIIHAVRNKATLPNGVTVELIGLCKEPVDGAKWWKPDGGDMPEPFFRADKRTPPLKGMTTQYTFLAKAQGGEDISIKMKIYEGFGWSTQVAEDGTALCYVKHPNNTKPHHEDAFSHGPIEVGVAQGQWIKGRGVSSSNIQTPRSYLIGSRDEIVIQPPRPEKNSPETSTIFWFTSSSHDYEYRLICTLKDGSVEECMKPFFQSTNKIETGGLKNSTLDTKSFVIERPLEQIVNYELLYRKFDYARFNNVAFEPNAKIDVRQGIKETISPEKLVMLLIVLNSCAPETDLNIDSVSITDRNISIKGDTSDRANTRKFLDAVKDNGLNVSSLHLLNAKDNRDKFSIVVEPKQDWQQRKTDVQLGAEQTVSPKLIMLLAAIKSVAAGMDLNIESISVSAKSMSIEGDTSGRTDTLKFLDAIKDNGLDVSQLNLDTRNNRDRFRITAEPKENWRNWWQQHKTDVPVEGEKGRDSTELAQLLEELKSEGHREREAAAQELGELRDPRVVGALIAALKDTDVGVRGAAARALGNIGDERAVEPLIDAYQDKEYESFVDAIWALGDIGGMRAEEILVQALSYQGYHPYVRNIAAKCLTKLGWEPADRKQKIRYLIALEKWEQAIKSGPSALLKPAGTNQAEGPFELNIPIVIPLEADKQVPAIVKCPWLQFSTAQGKLKATLCVRYNSWPHTKWVMKIDVLDAGGKVLGQAKSINSNSGIIEKIILVENAKVLFEFDRGIELTDAARFRFSIESIWTSRGNPIQFNKELPLALELNSAEQSRTIKAQWLKFQKNGDRVEGTIHLDYLSWPKAKWEVDVYLLDGDGTLLTGYTAIIENRGVIFGVPFVTKKDFRFSLEKWGDISKAVRYGVTMQRILDSTAKTDMPVEGERGDESPESKTTEPKAQEPVKQRGGVSGVVVNSVTGQPIAGAYVGVGDFGDSGGSNYSRHRSEGFHDKTKTDAEGRFELGGLVFTDKNHEIEYHPLIVTHPDFVRHDEKIELLSGVPAPDVKVSLRPAAKIDVTIVDADGNPIQGRWLLRLEALDGRRFIPPGSDPHLSSFASNVWAHWPDMRTNMGVSGGFTFTELDSGRYLIEAIRIRLVDKPTPGNIWKPTITYHGSIPSLKIEAGRSKQVRLTPQDNQTQMTITAPEFPDKLFDKLERSSQMPLMCLISRSPGALLWDDGKIRHLEDQRLGRIDKKRFFRGFFIQGEPLIINNLPPDSYSLFAMAVYGQVAGYLIGARVDLTKGDNITVDIPWRQPTGPSMFGPNRSFDYPVDLEGRDYSLSQLCENLTGITQSNPRIIADPSIENEKLSFGKSQMSVWDVLEKLYLDNGWTVGEAPEKTLILEPKPDSADEKRRVYLPDLETPHANVILDLATGEMLQSMWLKDNGAARLGKGDIVYEYAGGKGSLLCLRGATMQLRTDERLSSLEPDIRREYFGGYLLKEVPCQYQVTTAEGDKYELKVISIDKGDTGGAFIQFWKSEKKINMTVDVEGTAEAEIERLRETGARRAIAEGRKERIEFLGLDLTDAPRKKRSADLPDLFEARPSGSKSYHIRDDVTAVYNGLDGTVYYVPDKEIFYIQHGKLGASTLTYYGPFNGDPYIVLNLQTYPNYFYDDLRVVKSRPTIFPAMDSTTLQYEINMNGVSTATRKDHAERIIDILKKKIDRENEFKLVWKAVGEDKIEVTIPKDSEQRMKSIWGKAVDGIAYAVRPVKETFLIGQQLEFDLIYKNISREPITVCVFPDPFYVWTKLRVFDSSGMWVASGQHANGFQPPINNSHFVTLRPGETVSVRQNISFSETSPLKTGRYIVFASVNKINPLWEHIIGYEEFCKENNLTPWAAVVETGRSSFKIVSDTGNQQSKMVEAVPVEGEGAGEKISQLIGAGLPASVQNVKFHSGSFEAASKTWTRFDIPLSDLKNLLAESDMLPDFSDLHKNPRIQKDMDEIYTVFNIEWWKSDELESPVSSGWVKSSRIKGAPKDWIINILNICCSQVENNLMRVYISFYLDSPYLLTNPDMEREIEDPRIWSQELAGDIFAALRANDNDRLKALIADDGRFSKLQEYRRDYDFSGLKKMVHYQKADRCYVIVSPIRHKELKDSNREIQISFQLEADIWKVQSIETTGIGAMDDLLKEEGFNVFSEIDITREFLDTTTPNSANNSTLQVELLAGKQAEVSLV